LQLAPRKKGVTIRGGGGIRPKKTVTATYTLATTTPLVSQVFEECFSDQVRAGMNAKWSPGVQFLSPLLETKLRFGSSKDQTIIARLLKI
jgi:hypothetical protein